MFAFVTYLPRRMRVSPLMQRFRNAILLAVGAGFFLFQAMLMSVYAASSAQPALGPVAWRCGGSGESPEPMSYENHCAICHGEQREGILPAFPPLVGITRQMTDPQIIDLIHKGKGRMPAFSKLQNDELTALLRYLASPGLSTPEVASGSITRSTTRRRRSASSRSASAWMRCPASPRATPRSRRCPAARRWAT